jgi:hypothetical protein
VMRERHVVERLVKMVGVASHPVHPSLPPPDWAWPRTLSEKPPGSLL